VVGRLWRHLLLLLRDWHLLLLLHHGPHSMLLLLQLLLLDLHGILLVGMHLPLLLLLLLHLHLLLHAELVALLDLLHGLHSLLGVHLVQLGLDARGDGDLLLLLLSRMNHSLLLWLLMLLHLDHLRVSRLLHQLLLGVTLLDMLLLHVLGRHLLNNLHSLRLRLVGRHGWPRHHVARCGDWRRPWGKTLLLLRLHLLLHWRPRALGPHRHSRPSWHAGRLRALPLVVVVCPGGVVFLLFFPKLPDDFLHVVCLLGDSVKLGFLALVELAVVLLHIAKLRI
jgi:hypothetical protein